MRDPAPRKFIVLHLLNAHPAYYYRYPKSFARFNDTDDEVTKALKAAGRKFWAIRMRNYYDNAVLYADHVLKRSLDLCRASGQRLAWIFVPDHDYARLAVVGGNWRWRARIGVRRQCGFIAFEAFGNSFDQACSFKP